jgi:hypothetical protein
VRGNIDAYVIEVVAFVPPLSQAAQLVGDSSSLSFVQERAQTAVIVGIEPGLEV